MKILRPGEEGYGYLVEFDSGFISSDLTCQDGVCSNHNLINEFKSGLVLGKDGSLPDKIEIYFQFFRSGV